MKVKKYMLFADWEVRIVKKFDQGLEIAARDGKIQTMLITNQIVGFVTMTAWKKNGDTILIGKYMYFNCCESAIDSDYTLK